MVQLACVDSISPELKENGFEWKLKLPRRKEDTGEGKRYKPDFPFRRGTDTKSHRNRQSPDTLRRVEFPQFYSASSTEGAEKNQGEILEMLRREIDSEVKLKTIKRLTMKTNVTKMKP